MLYKWSWHPGWNPHFTTHNHISDFCLDVPHGTMDVYKGENFRREFKDGVDYDS